MPYKNILGNRTLVIVIFLRNDFYNLIIPWSVKPINGYNNNHHLF